MIAPILILLGFLQQINAANDAEIAKPETPGHVTICNSTYCDELTAISWCPRSSDLHVYVTSENGDRLGHSVAKFTSKRGGSGASFQISLNPCKKYQKIIGFGGALTDSSAWVASCLSEGAKKNFLNSYFHCEKGIGYDVLRIPLGGSDYSLNLYTYNDSPEPDPELKAFALNEMDTKYKIPLIKGAQAISCRNIRLKGASWHSPSWLTFQEPGNMTEILVKALPPELLDVVLPYIPPSLQLYTKNCIKEEYEKTWALYLSKALSEYKRQGIDFDYLSAGNEVQLAAVSDCWDRDRYQNWVTNTLCPQLKKDGHDLTKILALDDQTLFLNYWQQILENPDTRSCIAGFVTHWYLDFFPDTAKPVQENFCRNYPEQLLFHSESSACEYEPDFFTTTDWQKAVRYARDIITKLSSCSQGYIDWNIALDFQGGPNWVENYCYSAVAVNCTADEFHKRVLFYVLGHFSKFLPEGSVRIEATVNANTPTDSTLEPLQVVAFKVKHAYCWRGLGSIVTIALNTNQEDVVTDICLEHGKCATVTVPKNSIISTVSLQPWSHLCL